MHTSIRLEQPCEFINVTSINPLISKCQIKVCYVSDNPNRNRTVINKETAIKIAQSLPGSPIVGHYNKDREDFEEHNHVLEISNEGFKLTSNTQPYGFVDLNARVWFEKYNDEGTIHEYLVTEGYLWTGQYPETQRIIEKGNNQSLEFADENFDGFWSEDNNENYSFFIINEAIIKNLCILGENEEPCFEGAQITKFNFNMDTDFKQKMFSLMNSIQDVISKGGTQVFTTYTNVKVGDNLWNAVWQKIGNSYSIDGFYTAEDRNFVIVKDENEKFYSFDFSINTETKEISLSDDLTELTEYSASETPMFSEEEIQAYVNSLPNDETEEVKIEETEEEEIVEEEDTSDNSETIDTLEAKIVELEQKVANLETKNATLTTDNQALKEFKNTVEKEKKQEMIESFYMLSDEDKADVITNIDTYSLEDIEAKLSIICVRNKVSFDIEDETTNPNGTTTYNLNEYEDDVPAWVKAVKQTEKLKG